MKHYPDPKNFKSKDIKSRDIKYFVGVSIEATCFVCQQNVTLNRHYLGHNICHYCACDFSDGEIDSDDEINSDDE